MKRKLWLVAVLVMSIVFAVVMLAACNGSGSGNQNGDGEVGSSEGIIFTLNDVGDSYSVSGYKGNGGKVLIPSVYEGLPVESIGVEAFGFCYDITEMIIPDSIKVIGESAFSDCTGLTSVTIGKNVQTIEAYAFDRCENLSEILWNAVQVNDFIRSNNTAYEVFRNAGMSIDGLNVVFGESVNYIPAYTFYENHSLKSAHIGNNVASIGEHAFAECSDLETVVIGNKVLSIGKLAFENCGNLTAINIPSDLSRIEASAFSGCAGLTELHISDIEAWCNIEFGNSSSNPFSYAKKLYVNGELVTDLIIPDGITNIASRAFINGKSIKAVTIPASVETIGAYAFNGCVNLESIQWNATSVDDFAYNDAVFSQIGTNNNGTRVIFGEGATKIPAYAFDGCTLQSIDISDSVTGIGEAAFRNCTKLTTITIPKNITTIDAEAFNGCTGVTKVNWNAIKTNNFMWYDLVFGDIGEATSGTIVEFGNDVQVIPSNCFSETSITDIIIADNTTKIGSSSFESCYNLESVTIGAGVAEIGSGVFRGCTGLTSIVFPNSLRTIGSEAFEGCEKLSSVIIPAGATSIGAGAFADCIGLMSVSLPDSLTGISSKTFHNCVSLYSINIPVGITSVGESAFNGCARLTSVVLPDGVTSIGVSAFRECGGLAVVTIPDSVTSIGNYAFLDCTNIVTATMPISAIYSIPQNSLQTVVLTSGERISGTAFRNCDSLTSVTLPGSLNSIEEGAFSDCNELENVYYMGGIAEWCVITGLGEIMAEEFTVYVDGKIPSGDMVIPDGVATIEAYAFYGCDGLTSLVIPDSVTGIGSSAFYGCVGLTDITIPSSITSIAAGAFEMCINIQDISMPIFVLGSIPQDSLQNVILLSGDSIPYEAFSDCTSLLSVTIPDDVTTIGECAFYNCENLKSITIPGGVTTVGDRAFQNCISLKEVKWNAGAIGDDEWGYSVFSNAGTAHDGMALIFGDAVISLPQGVLGLNYAGDKAQKIKSISFGAGMTEILYTSFMEREGLLELTVSADNPYFYVKDNCIIEIATKTLVMGCQSSIIPSDGSVVSIGDGAFYDVNGLTSVTIFDCIVSLGINAFARCEDLVSLSLGSGINEIPDGCFAETGLRGVTIPDNIIRIGEEAFRECSGLGYVSIGQNVQSIESYAFQSTSIASVTIPVSVQEIGWYAFAYCKNLVRFRYSGTFNQWLAVDKSSHYNYNSAFTGVECLG